MYLRSFASFLLCAVITMLVPSVEAAEQIDVDVDDYNLEIDFPEPMRVLANTPVHEVSIVPARSLSCRWDDDTTIACAVEDEAPLPPATTLTVHIATGLHTANGAPIGAVNLTSEIARPGLDGFLETWAAGVPTLVVRANMPMTTDAIARVLELRSGTRVWRNLRLSPLPMKRNTRWEREMPIFAVALPADLPAGEVVEAWARKGLVSVAGPLPSLGDRKLTSFRHAEPFRVRAIGCSGRKGQSQDSNADDGFALDCVPAESLSVHFSAPLGANGRAAFAAMLPAGVRVLRWRTSLERFEAVDGVAIASGETAELQAPQPFLDVDIAIGAALRDAAGRPLQGATRVVIHNDAPRPSLRAASSPILVGDPSRGLVESVNAPALGIEVRGIGATPVVERFVAPDTRGAVATFRSNGSQRALSEGGWVRWRTERSPATLDASAPQFDLRAQISAREVVAWALGWENSRPIANSRIELLLLDASGGERIVASSLTGRDGVARLALPADFVRPAQPRDQPETEWLLRATVDQRRAVLPLGGLDSYHIPLGRNDAEPRLFVVADRPLYRAGEHLRFRGWMREEGDGRLRNPGAGDHTLALVSSYNDREILRWPVHADGEGAFTGEIALPSHMVDGDYCMYIAADYYYDDETRGPCLFIGTFRAQDLWVEATTATPLLRDGNTFDAGIEAGYWSGGGASGVAIQSVFTSLYAESPAVAYPAYAEYTFARSDTKPGRAYFLKRDEAVYPSLDADGRARVAIPVVFADDEDEGEDEKGFVAPPFGRLEMTAGVGLAGREAVISNVVTAHYARFDRYVGLRLEPRWFDARTPLRLQAVVIDAAGRAQAGARIEVSVAYVPEGDDADALPPVPVATCVLVADAPTPCDAPRTRSGLYRFTARSGDAAPAVIERYVWNASDTRTDLPAPESALTVIEAPATPTAPVRLLLRQPYAQADALVAVAAGDTVLDVRVMAIDRPETEFALPTFAAGRNRVDVSVLVREQVASSVGEDGLRKAPRTQTLGVEVDVPRPQDIAAIALELDAARATPGETIRIRVHNRSDRPRTVALTVLDDALRSLAGARWDAFDPRGHGWLGAPIGSESRGLHTVGFGGFSTSPWQIPLPWEDGKDVTKGDRTSPVLVVDRASLESVGDVLSNLTASDGGGFLSRRGTLGVPAPRMAEDDEGLDTVTVTGSRIKGPPDLGLADATAVGKPTITMTRETGRSGDAAARALFGAALRQDFADTALWLPDVRLSPGETREIALTVPHNLTRWLAVAWSADDGEDFEMAEAMLDVGLPLEVRLQTPVRVYPGDRAQLVANVRQTGDTLAQADAMLQVEVLAAETQATIPLAARGQGAFPLTIAPTDADGAPRTLTAVAAARVGADADAVAQPIELASPFIEARKVQAGWLGTTTLELGAPPLPARARDARLSVSLLPGADALVHGWIDDLQRYPHRCWEQILSRAVAAAVALERGESERFADAQASIDEALDNIAVFQGEQGDFRFFADAPEADYRDYGAHAPLTAYSARALRLLQSLGHMVPAEIVSRAEDYLSEAAGNSSDAPLIHQRLAFIAAGQSSPKRYVTDRLWRHFDALPLPAQVAAARAMAVGSHPDAADAVAKLLAQTKRRGEARTLRADARHDRWMSSDLREQCELIGLLLEHPQLVDAAMRRSLIAGLGDLYAGGSAEVDTQTGASCLMALRRLDVTAGATARLDILRGDTRAKLSLAAGSDATTWNVQIDADDTKRKLRLHPDMRGDAPASYRAEYRYLEDARTAESTAIGFALQRNHAVLRDGKWVPIVEDMLRDGDWVRVTLQLDNSAERFFVAITDAVPGGLRPTDLALSGVAGLDLLTVSDTGAFWFETRRLDPRAPKFYAEYLPPGRHEVHYFARVGNSGDYLAAPAVAELMYGEATRARTAAARILIQPAATSP